MLLKKFPQFPSIFQFHLNFFLPKNHSTFLCITSSFLTSSNCSNILTDWPRPQCSERSTLSILSACSSIFADTLLYSSPLPTLY